MSRPVPIVPHTHWDREWYVPFEAFRGRLVRTLDEVLDTLGRDPAWTSYLLDGQVAALQDYLEVRPAAASRVRRLVSDGRLDIGPWYVLMDEFCVSGETIVRNLQLGMERSADLGQRRRVGYLPDMFGHTSQMPQLLRLAGITQAVVWRGVPSAIESTGFWWDGPDGSRVRAEYLPVGYANGAFLPRDPGALVRRVAALEAEAEHLLQGPSTPLLVMNGTDHQPIQPHVPSTLSAANAIQDRFDFRLTSLADHLDAAPREGLPCWTGELRSGARAPILAGTISNRTDIKASAAAAEVHLENVAEPLATLWLPPDLWPKDELENAWFQVILNSAHDSICACSSDEVTRAVRYRYDCASTIAATLTRDACDIAGVATEHDGPVILNPSAHQRRAAVELVLRGDDAPVGCQVLRHDPGGRTTRSATDGDLGEAIGALTRSGWLGETGQCNEASLSAGAEGIEIDLLFDPSRRPTAGTAAVLAEAWALAGSLHDQRLTVRVNKPPTTTVVALSGDVPGFGWAAWKPAALPCDPVRAAGDRLDNGLVRVSVDPLDGTFSIGDLAGLDLLIDERDAGDTYNFDSPQNDLVVDLPDSTEVEVVEGGPVRGRLRVIRRFTWPSRLDDPTPLPVEVVTDLTLIAGESALRVETTFDNVCRDHRLRALFPLPSTVGSTTAGCAFAAVTRTQAEGGAREPALSTYPARGFVSAGGLSVLHEGVREYELIDDGSAIAVTLLRATGTLSKPSLNSRPNIAGPPIHVEGAQMLGPVRVRYAVAVGEIDPWQTVENLWTPMPTVESTGTGRLPPRGSRLEVSGGRVSSLRRSGGRIEIRVFNPSDVPTTVDIPNHRGSIVDLNGAQTATWQGSFGLKPWEIKTAVLDEISLDR